MYPAALLLLSIVASHSCTLYPLFSMVQPVKHSNAFYYSHNTQRTSAIKSANCIMHFPIPLPLILNGVPCSVDRNYAAEKQAEIIPIESNLTKKVAFIHLIRIMPS